jgi:hypothetical protein
MGTPLVDLHEFAVVELFRHHLPQPGEPHPGNKAILNYGAETGVEISMGERSYYTVWGAGSEGSDLKLRKAIPSSGRS